MYGSSLERLRHFERLLGLKLNPDLVELVHTIKMHENWNVPCHFVIFFRFTKDRWSLKWNLEKCCLAIIFQFRLSPKAFSRPCGWQILSPCNHSLTDEVSQASYFSKDKHVSIRLTLYNRQSDAEWVFLREATYFCGTHICDKAVGKMVGSMSLRNVL